MLAIDAAVPDPASVSPASGIVAYAGTPTTGQIGAGWLLVQLLAEERIKVEFFAGARSAPGGFSAAAQEYVR